jgi:hypothetical protein
MRSKDQSLCFLFGILVAFLVLADLYAQEQGWPTRPQPTAETHQFDALLGNWRFVEDLNLNNPKAPPTVKGEWTFVRAGDGFMINDEFRLFKDSGETIFLGETYRSYSPDRKSWEFQFAQPGKTSWQKGTSKVESGELIDLSESDGKTSRARFYNINAAHFSCDFEVYDSTHARWTGKKHVEATKVGSDAQLHPDMPDANHAGSTSLSADLKNSLLDAREAVWRAWFSNDREQLDELIPPETIAIDAGEEKWRYHDDVLSGSREFVASGGKLVKLKFPETEIQLYGPAAILYSKYQLATAVNGKTNTHSGRATEVFVHRGGKWLNAGWHLD